MWQHQPDDEKPPERQHNWLTFRNNLHLFNELQIDIHTSVKLPTKEELHGFCDASEVVSGFSIYVLNVNEQDNINVRLLCAKGKVALLKKLTIPQLELEPVISAAIKTSNEFSEQL